MISFALVQFPSYSTFDEGRSCQGSNHLDLSHSSETVEGPLVLSASASSKGRTGKAVLPCFRNVTGVSSSMLVMHSYTKELKSSPNNKQGIVSLTKVKNSEISDNLKDLRPLKFLLHG